MGRTSEVCETILDFKMDFSYESNKEKALNNVIGSISKGQCVVLCDESGCGKSTLLRCLNHLISVPPGGPAVPERGQCGGLAHLPLHPGRLLAGHPRSFRGPGTNLILILFLHSLTK